ncbi:MAG: N-acetyl-D-Glu racemase DgcA [Candidatus Latescibacterota bacterium]|nr:N-acetyl-D-Glu racemase DgcA [Candidatus Latescibacterota bacterium]
MAITVDVRLETFPLDQTFTISRGSKGAADVVVVELVDSGGHRGRGECVPYPRYGETPGGVIAQIESLAARLRQDLDRRALQETLPAGAARNAVDCALWELEARQRHCRVHELAGLPAPEPVTTAYTISLDEPARMRESARQQAQRPLLKLKLAGDVADADRVAAVREGAPEAQIIVDANEGFAAIDIEERVQEWESWGVRLVEQPLKADEDRALELLHSSVLLCADESCHVADDVERLRGRYGVVNIKLDKAGGLTEALRLRERARAAGMEIMVGCMVATSLSMAPAMLLAQGALVVDLDGPLLLSQDRPLGLRYEGSLVHAPAPDLWG